jgi:hypothetical protein
MKPRPKAVYHLGTCLQCGGEGDVLTIPDNPIDLSLCGDCLGFLMRDAAGIRSATRERWAWHDQRAVARDYRRLTRLEQKAQRDIERALRMDEGNGRGL